MRKPLLFITPMLLLVALCLTTGCSTHAMRAVPVFKSDPKPEEGEIDLERVNAWPLYYKDGDVRSAFWPLYTKTADGHALVPFYEYRKGDRSLRVGQITHLLPALASFEPERNHSWRVLLAYKEKAVARLGSFTREPGDGFMLIPPLLFWNGETLWTPLIARGKGDEHSMWGLLYPFFFVEKRGGWKQFYALAPLIAGWRGEEGRGAQVLPLFYYKRRDDSNHEWGFKSFNLGIVLAHYYNRPHDKKTIFAFAWPIFHHSQNGESWEKNFRSRTNVALLGFHNSRKSSGRYTYLLWPLVQNSDRGHTADGKWKGGWLNVLGPVFHHYRGPSKRYTMVLGPLVQHSNRGTNASGEWRGGWFNVLGLVFHRGESSNSSHTMFLWPFYQRGDRGIDTQGNSRGKWMNILGLVAHDFRSAEISSGHVLWPLWYHRVSRNQEQRIQSIAVELKSDARRDTLSHRFALAGLYAQRREVISEKVKETEIVDDVEVEKASHVDQRIRDHWRLFPLFWSEKFDTGESKFLVLWRLYDARRVPLETTEKEWRRERILWRLYRHEQRGTRTATDSFPFMSSARDTATGFKRWTLAGGLYERRTEEGVRTTKLLWIPVSRKAVE